MTFSMSSPTLMDSVFSPEIKSGEHPTASDDGNVKVRKPYTITKQRERWTEEEHQKFLEALKVHGRAWRCIEEHIGTKTAVQIRSHAQKFFSKLERETVLAGSTGNAEIEIPPPRPKRKPTHPYPRKASGAFLSSTPFEEENQSPSAVHSTAFTHLESKARTSLSKAPPKEPGTLNTSLRLFGQTVVPCKEMMGTDANQVDTSYSAVVESTGSPRSQLSGEVEQPSCTTSTSGVGHTSAPLMSRLEDTVGTTSNSQPHTCKATGDVDISSSKGLVESQNHDTSCFRSWQPDFWPGIVPPSIPHGSNEDMNAAGAFAAVSYAVVSAWQAIQGAMASANNEPNVNIVYSPMAILGAAKNPQPSHDCNHELSKNEQEGDGRDGHDTDRTNLHEEDSTAECCSSLTADTSNYECVPAKKHRRGLCIVTSEASNSHTGKAGSHSLFHDVSHIETPVKQCHKCMDEATRAANIRENGLADGLPVESSLCECSAVSSPVTEQALDLIIQACDLDSSMETDEEKEPTIGVGSHGSDQDTGSLSPASTMRGENATNISKECVERRNRDGLQSGDHLFMMKAGSVLYNRYSGVGFVPYKKRSTSFQ